MSGAIERGVQSGMEKAVPAMVDTVMAALFKHRAYPVIAGCQLRLIEAGMEPVKAWEYARKLLIEHCELSGVEIGHHGHAWDQQGGREIAEEDIRHWERPA